MVEPSKRRPSVPGSDPILGHGSDRERRRKAEGAKNTRLRPGYHRRRLHIATYNVRTLSSEEKLLELEEELKQIKWDIVGLSEVRRKGEECLTLKSGHQLYYKGNADKAEGGVGFIINKNHIKHIQQLKSINSRIIFCTLKLNSRTNIKVIQVYAPTTTHSDEEMEAFYEDLDRAIRQSPTRYNLLIGDFNAKLGCKMNETETAMGHHGYGRRNERGNMLLNFLLQNGLFAINTFFKKTPQRKWTWASPDGATKNEIDFIITDKDNAGS